MWVLSLSCQLLLSRVSQRKAGSDLQRLPFLLFQTKLKSGGNKYFVSFWLLHARVGAALLRHSPLCQAAEFVILCGCRALLWFLCWSYPLSEMRLNLNDFHDEANTRSQSVCKLGSTMKKLLFKHTNNDEVQTNSGCFGVLLGSVKMSYVD